MVIVKWLENFHHLLSWMEKSLHNNHYFIVVQSLSHVQLFVTPWTAARQASLSFTISQSLLKLMSFESVMPSNHLILVIPFSSCLQSFPESGFFPVSWLFVSGGQGIRASASASVLQLNIQYSFPLGFPLGLFSGHLVFVRHFVNIFSFNHKTLWGRHFSQRAIQNLSESLPLSTAVLHPGFLLAPRAGVQIQCWGARRCGFFHPSSEHGSSEGALPHPAFCSSSGAEAWKCLGFGSDLARCPVATL